MVAPSKRSSRTIVALAAFSALVAMAGVGCLSARATARSYFVLHGEAREPVAERPPISGLVRVRNLDTDAVYEKFQIVVRKSPYQLRYSDSNVWAVKPNQMVADVVAQSMETANLFSGVTRELVDARPRFTLSGQLQAIEVYDSEDLWFAHLEISLYLTRFSDGQRLWTMDFDQRKQIERQDFGHAARALSELMQIVLTQAIAELSALEDPHGRQKPALPRITPDVPVEEDPEDPRAPVLIPETNRTQKKQDPDS